MDRFLCLLAFVASVAIGGAAMLAHSPVPLAGLTEPAGLHVPVQRGAEGPARPSALQETHYGTEGCRCTQRLQRFLGLPDSESQSAPTKRTVNAIGNSAGPSVFTATELFANPRFQVQIHQRLVIFEAGKLPASLHGVPWLQIRNPEGVLVYEGGYDPEPIWDQAIVRELLAGQQPAARPVSGCARQTEFRPVDSWRAKIRKQLQSGWQAPLQSGKVLRGFWL